MNTLLRIMLLVSVIFLLPNDSGFTYKSTPISEAKVETAPLVESVPINSPKVILITLDGVRWQDVFEGTDPLLYDGKIVSSRELLPNMYRYFVDQGMVVGKNSPFVATGPAHISLPGYLEIMRGHPSTDCQSNECEPKLDETMADLFETSAVFASWDVISKTVSKNSNKFVINCGRNYRTPRWKEAKLKDNTKFPEYWNPLYRPDNLTQLAVLEYLQHYEPQFVWISLGDTDEWAHAGNYKQYIASLVEADKFIGQMIAQTNSNDYTFIITADHGRGLNWRHHGWDQESAKLWLMMRGRSIPAKGFVSYSETKSLSNILPTVKELTGKHNPNSLL